MNLFNWNSENADREVLSGLRLHRLELYNWGTFDKAIWVYEPKGETTLLTGDSGSGKSTIVDALTTLLVSPRKIAYNKAADAGAKERTVASYVQGVYGQKSAYEGKGKAEALRDTKHFSVILGIFKDEAQDTVITLGSFFWFKEQSASPNRFYLVAKRELSIAKDFTNFGSSIRDLRARLKASGTELFDEHKKYEEYYRNEFGKIKPQAINLFQQTISMKKVESLTEFVRDNMLEETGISDEIQKLLSHYHDLDTAHEAVVRARKQIEILTPIYNNGIKRTLCEADLATVKTAQETLPYWFALIKNGLFEKQLAQFSSDRESLKSLHSKESKILSALDDEIKKLEGEIFQNGGQTLQNLKDEIDRHQLELTCRGSNLLSYKERADKVSFSIPKNAYEFRENIAKIPQCIAVLEQSRGKAQADLAGAMNNLKNVKDESEPIKSEIASLQKRTSNIPEHLIKLRYELCQDLKIKQEDIPFAGELIEVKESELDWEGALERLMHSFAMSLLVSEKLYDSVSKWVNQKHLGTRLVYLHTKQSKQPYEGTQLHPNAVANKVCFKEDSPHFRWLSNEVKRQFDHICCDEIAVFQQSNKAITKSGQIKSRQRHEKDDRNVITDRTRYVLGFSNKKKIEAFTQKLDELYEKKQNADASKAAAENNLNKISEKGKALSNLEAFSNFSEIDVDETTAQIAACYSKIAEIESGNSVLKLLNEQLAKGILRREEQKLKVSNFHDSIVKLDERKEIQEKNKQKNDEKLLSPEAVNSSSCEYLEKNQKRYIGNAEITLDSGDKHEREYSHALQEALLKQQRAIDALTKEIEKRMKDFINAFPNEAREIEDKIEYWEEYENILSQLNKDDLPRFEANFKELLKSKMLQQIAIFHAALKNHSSDIKERIEDINKSMYEIDYDKDRYIRLNCDDNPDSEIKEFKIRLRACTEGAIGGVESDELSETKFMEVKEILSRFQGREKKSEIDERWTKKVTDVRNWFLFSASERWRGTNQEYAFYPDSGGKSGGQKEKLAYTILAASLVYNYGLNEERMVKTSFRLVAIDEAFLKSSDDSAKYGLELFKQLDFQLVIV